MIRNNNYAISKMSLEELEAESERLSEQLSNTTDEFRLEEISAQLENIDKRREQLRNSNAESENLNQEVKNLNQEVKSTVDYATTQENPSVQYIDYDINLLDEEVRDFYEQIGELGEMASFKVRIVQNLENDANGMYDGHGNILISSKAAGSIESIRKVASHEIYHHMKNTDEHKQLQDLAFELEQLKNPNITMEQFVQNKIDDYYHRSKGKVQLDKDGAWDEIGAELVDRMLTDKKLAEQIWTEMPTLAQRIVRAIEDLLRRYKNRKLSAIERQEAELLRQARDMYMNGLQSMKYAQQSMGESRYMFAGENSRTADREALARAKQMEANGADMESIRQATGWFKSKVTGNEWAYEISDKGIEFSRNAPRFPVDFEAREIRRQMVESLTGEEKDLEKYKQLQKQLKELPTDTTPRRDILMDWMSHPELYEAYPQLRNTPFKLDETINADGEFDGNTIRVNSSLDKMYTKDGIPVRVAIDDTTRTMLHEVQHAIQRIEGFPRGSSPAYWAENKIPTKESLQKIADAEKKIADVEAKFRKEWPNDEINLNLVKRYDELDKIYFSGKQVDEDRLLAEMAQIEEAAEMSGFDDLLTEYLEAQAELSLAEKYPDYITPFDAYQNTAGEIMARNTANRRNLNAEQRKQKQPAMGDENTVYADGGVGYSIGIDGNGDKVVIVDNDIYSGNMPTTWKERIDFVENKLIELAKTNKDNVFARIIESGREVYLDADVFPDEYVRSNYSYRLKPSLKNAKFKATGNLKEIIEIARNERLEPNKTGKGNNRQREAMKKGGMYRYDISFAFPTDEDGKYNVYDAELLVRKDGKGKDYLYDIVQINERGLSHPLTSGNNSSAAVFEKSSFDSDILPQSQLEVNSGNHKEQQLAIIQNGNAMQDDYHTGIRSVDDILTFEEAIQEDMFAPDYTEKDAQNALRKGKITVYSSYPISQGVFVTPSKMEAQNYAGNGKVYSKTIALDDVAWVHDTRTVVVTLPNGTVLNLPVDEEIPGFGVSPMIENGRTLVPIA